MASPVKVVKFHLFNCDKTYNLDSVETLLVKVANNLNIKILVDKRNFRLHEMQDVCERTIPMLQMDYAVFVVHANESRLSINEDNAGIGYAKIYRTLLQATAIKNTKMKTKKTALLSLAGHEEKWKHSLRQSISMEERASFFLGTRDTERSTKKH